MHDKVITHVKVVQINCVDPELFEGPFHSNLDVFGFAVDDPPGWSYCAKLGSEEDLLAIPSLLEPVEVKSYPTGVVGCAIAYHFPNISSLSP